MESQVISQTTQQGGQGARTARPTPTAAARRGLGTTAHRSVQERRLPRVRRAALPVATRAGDVATAACERADEAVLAAIENAALRARARWVVQHIRQGCDGLSFADVAAIASPAYRNAGQLLMMLAAIHQRGRGKPPAELVSATAEGPWDVCVRLISGAGAECDLRIGVAAEPPHGIERLTCIRAVPEARARRASERDAAVLSALQGRTPITCGGTATTIDPGEHYWDHIRLMGEDSRVSVAEVDGRVVAMSMAAARDVRLDGETRRLAYGGHLRVLPELQGRGLRDVLMGDFQLHVLPHVDGTYGLIRAGNSRTERVAVERFCWEVLPIRAVLRCADVAGPEAGRAAGPADADAACDIINAAHGNEELFTPYTPDGLTERLGRLPERYGWAQLRRTERAVLGVWYAGDRHVVERDGERREARRALVLDYGCAPGGEGELEALLRDACRRCLEEGMDELALFTSDVAPELPLLERLGARRETFGLQVAGFQQPENLRERGVWIDPIYV